MDFQIFPKDPARAPLVTFGGPKKPEIPTFQPSAGGRFFPPAQRPARFARRAPRGAGKLESRKMPENSTKMPIPRGKTARNAQKVLKNASTIPDSAPGDTRGGPQCRGNARKRPPKPPIWRKKCYKHPQKPGKRPAGSRGIVKCLEKAPKVLETPPKSRFCSKIPKFRGDSSAAAASPGDRWGGQQKAKNAAKLQCFPNK